MGERMEQQFGMSRERAERETREQEEKKLRELPDEQLLAKFMEGGKEWDPQTQRQIADYLRQKGFLGPEDETK